MGVEDQLKPARPADAATSLPSVLAVVVTHDPGPWFEECLESFRDQDYARLSVIVVDTASADDPTARIDAVLPEAAIIRQQWNHGFAAAANAALGDAPRAALYLFCHDDISLRPDAVSHLVDEVLRSNAAIVGPKFVDWDNPSLLQHVGLAVDKFGVTAPLAEEGELDQEQYDAVTDVFAVPGGCVMVRADLFRTLSGYDEAISYRGDDVDLCWRAQLAGARVMVVPDAVVRHRERLNERRGVDDVRRLRMRHQLRTMLTCYSLPRLVRIVPQAAVLAFVEIVHAVVRGRLQHARDVAGAWWWNLRRVRELRTRRKAIHQIRQIGDAELHRMHTRGSARLRAYLRGQIGRHDDAVVGITSTGRQLASTLREPAARNAVIAVGLLAIIVLGGSRHLITRPIPAIGELQSLSGGTRALLADWWRGWHTRAMGSSAPAPTALGLLGLAGIPLFGKAALLRTILVLGPVPLGAVGMWRLVRPFGSRRANVAGTIVYVATPVITNAYARGSWSTLVMFAAAPWLLNALAYAIGVRPYVRIGRGAHSRWRAPLAFGVLLALVTAAVPFALVVVWVAVVGLLVGSLVAGDGRGLARLASVCFTGTVVALVLHAPWTFSFIRGNPTWASFGAAGTTHGHGLAVDDLVRFHTGPFGGTAAGYGLLVAAGFVLLIGQGPRLGWAVRGWFVALAAWALVWIGERGWLSVALPDPGVTLAVAAAGLAFACALGMVAFETDLRRHRFGWRQLAPATAIVALGALLVPFAAGAIGGRWKMPSRDFSRTYAALVDDKSEGGARILWIGQPSVLPIAGFDLDGTVAYATTDDRGPSFVDRWGGADTTGVPLVRDAIEHAVAGDTSRLGRLLAPFGIRYVVAVEHLAPAPTETPTVAIPKLLARTLGTQLDLERVVGVNQAVTVYRNNSWAAVRTLLPDGIDPATGADNIAALARVDLAASQPTLGTVARDGITARGNVPAQSSVYVATTAAREWHLEAGGQLVERADAFGWANVFAANRAGDAKLYYDTPLRRRLLLIGQIVVWIAAWLALTDVARRRVRQ